MNKLFLIVVAFIAAVAADASTSSGATVEVRFRGDFGGFNESISNLPSSSYPLPQLFGGSFHGEFSYASDAMRANGRFPFEHVDVSIVDNQGDLLHRIDSGPNGIFVGNGNLRFHFGESSRIEAVNVPEDLRISFSGPFSHDDEQPPTALALSAATFTPFFSFVEVDGTTMFTSWDVDVVSTEIMIVPEPSCSLMMLSVWLSTLAFPPSIHGRQGSK